MDFSNRRYIKMELRDQQLFSSSSSEFKCTYCFLTRYKKYWPDSCVHEHNFCLVCLFLWTRIATSCPRCEKTFKFVIYHVSGSVYAPLNFEADVSTRIDLHPEISVRWRAEIYRVGLYACSNGRVTDEFYRRNEIFTLRVLKWMNRDLMAILQGNKTVITFLMKLIIILTTRYQITSQEFFLFIDPYLKDKTWHFIHELVSFALTPYDLETYDRLVIYSRLTDTHNLNLGETYIVNKVFVTKPSFFVTASAAAESSPTTSCTFHPGAGPSIHVALSADTDEDECKVMTFPKSEGKRMKFPSANATPWAVNEEPSTSNCFNQEQSTPSNAKASGSQLSPPNYAFHPGDGSSIHVALSTDTDDDECKVMAFPKSERKRMKFPSANATHWAVNEAPSTSNCFNKEQSTPPNAKASGSQLSPPNYAFHPGAGSFNHVALSADTDEGECQNIATVKPKSERNRMKFPSAKVPPWAVNEAPSTSNYFNQEQSTPSNAKASGSQLSPPNYAFHPGDGSSIHVALSADTDEDECQNIATVKPKSERKRMKFPSANVPPWAVNEAPSTSNYFNQEQSTPSNAKASGSQLSPPNYAFHPGAGSSIPVALSADTDEDECQIISIVKPKSKRKSMKLPSTNVTPWAVNEAQAPTNNFERNRSS